MTTILNSQLNQKQKMPKNIVIKNIELSKNLNLKG